MPFSIYTYSNPYEINKELYWDSIKNCPHFCVSQTMANGMMGTYEENGGTGLQFRQVRLFLTHYQALDGELLLVRFFDGDLLLFGLGRNLCAFLFHKGTHKITSFA